MELTDSKLIQMLDRTGLRAGIASKLAASKIDFSKPLDEELRLGIEAAIKEIIKNRIEVERAIRKVIEEADDEALDFMADINN